MPNRPAGSHQRNLVNLLRGAQRGSRKARDALLAELYPRMRRYLLGWLHKGKRQREIDDVVQEAALRVLRSLRGCHASVDGELVEWAIAVAHSAAIDQVRREHAHAVTATSGRLHSGGDDFSFAEPSARLVRLLEAYGDESDFVQQILWLRLIQGLTWIEAAREMDSTPSAVKRVFQRARERLRRKVVQADSESTPR